MWDDEHLISTIIHLHVVSVHVQLHVLVTEHSGRSGVPVVTGHVVGEHQYDVTGEGKKGEINKSIQSSHISQISDQQMFLL